MKSPKVHWGILNEDGTVTKGSGSCPPPGWFSHVRRCLGLALRFPGHPPVYAVRPTCSNDVERDLAGNERRWWGVTPEPGSQVWFFMDGPLGGVIGFGRDTSEVERLVACLQGKLEPEKVAGGPDQRDRTEQVQVG